MLYPSCLESVWNLFDDGLLLESRREAMEERAQGKDQEVGAGVWVHGMCRNCLAIAIGVLREEEGSKLKQVCPRARVCV